MGNLIEHVVYHDMEMRVLWANKAACQSAGLELDQVVGRHCYEIWPKRSVPCDACPVTRSWKTRLPQSMETKTPDGRSWYISASPVFDDRGQIVAMVELTLEITERVQATEALKTIQNEQGQLIKERPRELVRLNEQLRQEIEERKETKRPCWNKRTASSSSPWSFPAPKTVNASGWPASCTTNCSRCWPRPLTG